MNSSYTWAIRTETTIIKKAISGTELEGQLIHPMAVWPLRGTPTGRRNGPTGISWISAKGNANSATRGRITPWTSTKEKKHFYFRGDQTLEQVVQAGCWDCILGSIQNLAGHSLEQPALVGPAVRWELGLDDLQRSLLGPPTSTILWLFISFAMRALICKDRPNLYDLFVSRKKRFLRPSRAVVSYLRSACIVPIKPCLQKTTA